MSTLFGKKRGRKTVNKRKRDDLDAVKESCSPLIISNGEDEQAATNKEKPVTQEEYSPLSSFADLGLAEPLVQTCHALGYKHPTPVQRALVPFLLTCQDENVLALAATGTGKTAAYVLPILQHCSRDPFSVFAVILTPTRELAQQIQQAVLALGSHAYAIKSVLVVGGLDAVQQACTIQNTAPHVIVATPGRLAALLRGPPPRPRLPHARYLVLDEADRLLTASSGFERDVAEIVVHCNNKNTATKKRRRCQTLLFSATMTASLSTLEELAITTTGGGQDRLPLRKFIIPQDGETTNTTTTAAPSDTDVDKNKKSGDSSKEEADKEAPEEVVVAPKIPVGLQQEYIFMPDRVRDAYLLATIRTLMAHGGRLLPGQEAQIEKSNKKKRHHYRKPPPKQDDDDEAGKAKSAIVFCSTCERTALISGILERVGVPNVALHSLLSQPRRLAALHKFQSELVRVLVATDVASRGLDIPHADLVINCELPRSPVHYIHRVGRTARAGRRGRAVSLVSESDVALVQAAERASGRELLKNTEITDEIAVQYLGPAQKAARLTKLHLQDIEFDKLVQKFQERKARDRKERQRLDKALRKQEQEQG